MKHDVTSWVGKFLVLPALGVLVIISVLNWWY